ncbi:putative 3-hydroxyacyl-CoA dehydrogenase, NAD binding domain [Penicillium brasilianum]|uniref:Putative 3-hydroxyacyl-CoA dehydrogenase, NAD binding domain n=1 Tax=Penicillium brasilianum TaxID=104259 RepID=A0A1S9RWL1_PENBI|nr:putative 3-hydroxyacyl-CoA dehydrogenase, NAD binding domain [Penicillium brasilianum]
MSSSWTPPNDYESRPVAILGAGVLGRRIGCIWASAGFDVRLRDPSPQQREDGIAYIQDNVILYAQKTGKQVGAVHAFESLEDAVASCWLVIEAVPEKIQLKIDTFGELDSLAPADCILASNSSSYKSSEMLDKVSEAGRSRILNMHYYMPPQCMIVELMTDGHTEESIFPFMIERCKEGATLPYVARKESTGFIFNRLWAAVKRETLTILAEGVSVPEEIDSLWTQMFVKGGSTPCRTMDDVGLDTVAFIESHYVEERGLSPKKTVDYLQAFYINDGKLGTKSSQGGLYPPQVREENHASKEPRLVVLDIGLSSATPSMTSGSILEISANGQIQQTLVEKQALPDGIAIDPKTGRLFWTNMGIPGEENGSVLSYNPQTKLVETIIPSGRINTPKQLALDSTSNKLYFSDREGLCVYRCNFDGTSLEKIVEAGNPANLEEAQDARNWCVGIAVAPKLGKFYWTQKGPSKGGQGRIFCANISTPVGQNPSTRSDIECVQRGLPEPIDLEVDESNLWLYWTDRGEIPFGNSLNRVRLNKLSQGSVSQKPEVLARNFNETIGLKLDVENDSVYVTDLGGGIYRCGLTGESKSLLYADSSRAFTGIAIL